MDDSKMAEYRQQYSHYARRLLSDLGLGDLPEPERGQFLATIEGYVSQVLLNTLLENIDDSDATAVEEQLEQGKTNEEAFAYLVGRVPNAEVKLADRMAEVYAQMLAEAKQLSAAIVKPTASDVV